MSLIVRGKSLLSKAKYLRKCGDRDIASKLRSQAVQLNDFEVDTNARTLFLREFDLSLHLPKHGFLLNGIAELREMVRSIGARLKLVGDELQIEVQGITVHLQTYEELCQLREIFISGVYGLKTNAPLVAVDIGMNVGFASLLFAKHPNIQAVLAYEPFAPTFQQGLRNIRLNPSISHKITAKNFGLGGKKATLKTSYCYELKGSVGTAGLPSDVAPLLGVSTPLMTKETIEIQDVVEEINRVVKLYPDVKLLAKIDCEGSEYEIIERLYGSNVLARFDYFLIEWHRLGPAKLLESLLPAGFECISLQPLNPFVGMLYAWRTR